MVADNLKEKYEAQTSEIYRALGEFVVKFEHLMYAAKNKISMLYLLDGNSKLLLEPYSARQTIDLLCDLIDQRSGELKIEDADRALFKALISDLRAINTERNKVIHTTWFIGWASEKDTDFSEAHGYKFASQKNFRAHTISASTFEQLTARCKELHNVLFTIWPIDVKQLRGPALHTLYERSSNGSWARK